MYVWCMVNGCVFLAWCWCLHMGIHAEEETNGPLCSVNVESSVSDRHRIKSTDQNCFLLTPGQQVIEDQRRRLAELKQRAAAEAQCQWEALHSSSPSYSPVMAYSLAMSHSAVGPPPLIQHSILHHQPPSAGEQPYDTLSLESSDSMDTSVSTGNNSACSPDNMSRYHRVIHTSY